MLSRLFHRIFKKWARAEDGVAAMESVFVFPILMVLLLGTFDLGNAILANQKTIRASQVTADLVTRDRSVNSAAITEAITAGELALQPFDTASFGVDIVSIRFDDEAAPQIEWRETRNMPPNSNVLLDVAALAEAGSGVVVVTIQYSYDPVFTGFSIGDFAIGILPMQETAFARGRKSSVVERI